jgi:hypothetical protein
MIFSDFSFATSRDLDLHPNMHATGCGSWQPNRPLAPGEMHGPALALAISARFDRDPVSQFTP